MPTTTKGRKANSNVITPSAKAMNAEVFAAMLSDFEMKIYGAGGAPLYDLVTIYGEVVPINDITSSFDSFMQIKETLKEGDAGFSYSEEYDHYTLAIAVPNGGIVFAGLLHDKDGKPKTETTLVICRVMANRDFDLEGETIIKKGQEFIKALPESYAMKLQKAA